MSRPWRPDTDLTVKYIGSPRASITFDLVTSSIIRGEPDGAHIAY